MSERSGYSPAEDQPKDPGRRNFLKMLGIETAALALGGGIVKYSESKTRNSIEKILAGPRKEVLIEKGDTIDGFYRESGYDEIEVTYYEEAFSMLNRNIHDGILPEGTKVFVPYKGEE